MVPMFQGPGMISNAIATSALFRQPEEAHSRALRLDQRFGPPPGQTGLLARSGHPAGAPEAAMASATEREEFHLACNEAHARDETPRIGGEM
jgi:hypothetical protein